jgi:hypothetical protein
MIRLKVTPVVGLPQFTGWSQVAESTSSASTRLVSVFAISGKHAGNVGRDVSDKISDFYYYDVKQLHEFIEELVEFVEKDDCKLFISCALINGDKSVFATRGGSVFLKRKEKAGNILYSGDKTKIVEGSYTDDDVFVLTTYQASQFLNEIEQKFIQGFDVDIIITSVVPGLHAQTDSSLSAIVFINKIPNDENKKPASTRGAEDNDSSKLENPVPSGEQVKYKKSKRFEINMDLSPEGAESKFVAIAKKTIDFSFKLVVFGKVFFKKSFDFIKSIDLSGVLPLFKSTVRSIKEKGLKKIFLVTVLLLVPTVIVFSVGLKNKKEKEEINSVLLPIQEKIISAKEQLDEDPITSRDIVAESISVLEKLKEDKKDSSALKLIDLELAKTTDFYQEISGKEELEELKIFYDLRLVKSDYIANNIYIDNSKLVLLDSEKKQIIILDILTKKVDVRDFSEYDEVRNLAVNKSVVFVLANGIQSFDLEDNSEIKEVRNLGDSNRNATFINSYDRFVYVLSPDKRNIYRYSKDDAGYSDPIGWMTSATGLKYNEITSFSVDGDIWFSTVDGQIKKFSGGKEDNFEIRGLNEEFSSSIKVFTNSGQENIYVLEADQNRVVILSKSGEFKREIKSVSLSTVGAIAVSEELGKIFAMSGSIVFEIDLVE